MHLGKGSSGELKRCARTTWQMPSAIQLVCEIAISTLCNVSSSDCLAQKIPAVWFQPNSVSDAHLNFTAFLAIGPQSVSLTDEDGGWSGTKFRQVDCHSDLTQTGFARKQKHTLDTSLQRGVFHLASIKPYRLVLTMRLVAALCLGPLATG